MDAVPEKSPGVSKSIAAAFLSGSNIGTDMAKRDCGKDIAAGGLRS
jgi:hypothetical protein